VRSEGERDTGTAAARRAPTAEQDDRRAPTFDNVLERWRHGCAKAGLAGELGASNAVLTAAAALHRLQFETVDRMRRSHEQAQGRLAAARCVAEVADAGQQLARTNAEDALHNWSRTAEIVLRGGAQAWGDALAAFARAQTIGEETGRHWLDAAAEQGPAEALEVQLNRLVTPAAALPLLWPAQESVREAVTLGTRAWHDWFAALPSAKSNGRTAPTTH
jgi:hypothetical protein